MEQFVYISLDDSGKLTRKEEVSVYGGLVFLSKKEKDKFITQYRSIIKDIKGHYSTNQEIKNTSIKKSDKRRVMNYLKKYYVVGLVIKNNEIYDHIVDDKASKGRFIDYSMRRLIKEIIKALIKNKNIDSHQPIKMIINIDEQTTKSNGYYNLRSGIIEELKYGINNFNYASNINPIIHNDLDVQLQYQNSKYCYVVQAADLLAGTIRRTALDSMDKLNDLVWYCLIIPPRKKAT